MAKAKKVNVDKRVESWLPICPAATSAAAAAAAAA